MKLSKTQNVILGLLLTAVVMPTNAADDFMDRLVLGALLKKEVKTEEARVLMQDLPVVHAARASEDLADTEVSELVLAINTKQPGEEPAQTASNAGVVPQLKATGRDVNDDNKFIARQLKKSGFSISDNDKFSAAEDAYGDDLFTTHAEFSAKSIIESVAANKKAHVLNPTDDANIRPLLEVSKIGVPAKPRYQAARDRLMDGHSTVQAANVGHPTTEEIKASAFLDKDGDNNPPQNLFDQVKTIQALGIEKPVAAIRAVHAQLIAGGGHLPPMATPSRMDILTGMAINIVGGGNPTPEQFAEAKLMLGQIEAALRASPHAKMVKLEDPRVFAAVNHVVLNHAVLGVDQNNWEQFAEASFSVYYLATEHGRVMAGITEADLDGLDYLMNKLKIQKPSKKELKAVKELQDDGQNLDIQAPSKEDIAAVIQLQRKVASGGLNIQHPTEAEFNSIKNLQVKYKIAQPTLRQDGQRIRLETAGVVDLKGSEIVEADRLHNLGAADRIQDASIEDIRESLRLALQQGADALPSIKPNIDEGRRLQGVPAGATKEPTGRQILEGIRLATAGGAPDRVANAHIDMINDSLRLKGLVGPDRIAAPTKTILDESKRLHEAANGIKSPTGRQIQASLQLKDAGVMDHAIALPSGAQVKARVYAHTLANAPKVGAYANTDVRDETNAIAYIMTDPDDRLKFAEEEPDEAIIDAAVKLLTLPADKITQNNWAAIAALHTEQEALVAPAIDPRQDQIEAVGKLEMGSSAQDFVAWKIQKEVTAGDAAYLPCFLAKCVAKDAAFITFEILESFKDDADLFAHPVNVPARFDDTKFKVSIGAAGGEIPVAFAGALALNQLVAVEQLDVDAVVNDRVTVAGIDKK